MGNTVERHSEKWKWMKDDLGSLFQTLEVTDENDLDLAISVFRVEL